MYYNLANFKTIVKGYTIAECPRVCWCISTAWYKFRLFIN